MKNYYWIRATRIFLIAPLWLLMWLLWVGETSGVDFSELDHQYSEEEREAKMFAIITYMNVSAPLDHFLLIRKDKDICAVRFTEFHRGHDAKPGTIFNSGEETLYAEYDWYYQGDGSGDFTKPRLKSGHRKLVRKPLIGIGRLAFQTGTIDVKCGPFELGWIYPNHVAFFKRKEYLVHGVELAPSKEQEISEVRVNDPCHKWYQYDEKEERKRFSIPLDELC